MINTTHSSSYNPSNEWISMIIDEQRKILASRNKNPIEILFEVFELFDENFDMSEIKEIKLYDYLNTLYNANATNPIISSLEEYFTILENIAICFQENKSTIRSFSVELYYALLNFFDLLKDRRIYYKFSIFAQKQLPFSN